MSDNMGKIVSVLVLMVILAVANARDWRFNKIRVRRGFNNGGFGSNDGSAYGRGNDDHDASVSREGGGCSGESGRSYSSRELAFNRDGRSSNEDHRGGRSFSKSSASASASAIAFNQNHKANLNV